MVQGTNDSSIVSKWSMSSVGYFTDEFLQHFVGKKCRRSPLINRGYYIRAKAVEYVFHNFLQNYDEDVKVQVISLGAGFDSSYFRLKNDGYLKNAVYVEIDFPDVVKRKAALIQQNETLSKVLGEIHTSEAVLKTSDYLLLGVDLTNQSLLATCLKQHNIRTDLPTLILSEVVLTYVSCPSANNVISWASKYFSRAMFVAYEQIQPYDGFGKVMMNHFQKLGSPLRCINTYPNLINQVHRYTSLGWDFSVAVDMNYFYNNYINETERKRIEHLEPFDEYEEWHLKCSHYILLCAFQQGSVNLKEKLWSNLSKYNFSHEISVANSKGDFEKNSNLGNVATQCSLKCTSSVVSGMFGFSSSRKDGSDEIQNENTNLCSNYCALHIQCDKTFHPQSSEWTKRFGHRVTEIDNKQVVITGGFGENNKLHTRLKNITVVDMESKNVSNLDTSLENQMCMKCNKLHTSKSDSCCECPAKDAATGDKFISPVERLFHTVTLLQGNKLLVYGGRTSPLKCCDDVCLLEINQSYGGADRPESSQGTTGADSVFDNLECCWQKVITGGDIPCARWRHSASLLQIEGQDYLCVYGGRSVDCLALNDCYLLNTQTYTWSKVILEGCDIGPLHSHAATVHDNTVIVSGGLNHHQIPSSLMHQMHIVKDLDGFHAQVHRHECSFNIQSRYSHTSAVVQGCLVLIGGVSTQTPVPGMTIVNLTSGHVRNIDIKVDNFHEPLLLHNHQLVRTSEREAVIFGGGGNCFSFGTHFNDGKFLIKFLTEHFKF